jgi:hypothetical protein
LHKIKVLHLEPTDVCQAACPLCVRETDTNFNKQVQHHLTISHIQEHFDDRVIKELDKVFMCGNYGDPAAGKHTLDIYRWFRNLNPSITLGMNTNGALQSTSYWHELGKMFNQPRDYVVFSIDGLSDTNQIYRKNVNWNNLMSNAKSYISAGGSAHWDMLVYRHNQHQVDACEQLAREMGFTWFRAKVSKRAFTDQLEFPIGWQPAIIKQGPIKCHILKEQSQYIDAQGRLSPCCWLGARQKDFVENFKELKIGWDTDTPNRVCKETCTSSENKNSFTNQFQREIQLC